VFVRVCKSLHSEVFMLRMSFHLFIICHWPICGLLTVHSSGLIG
jgi:hypothetical protein